MKGSRDEWEPAQLVVHRGTPCHRQLRLHSAEKLVPVSPHQSESETTAGEVIAALSLRLKRAHRQSERWWVPGLVSTRGMSRPVSGILKVYAQHVYFCLSVGGCACIKECLSRRSSSFFLKKEQQEHLADIQPSSLVGSKRERQEGFGCLDRATFLSVASLQHNTATFVVCC